MQTEEALMYLSHKNAHQLEQMKQYHWVRKLYWLFGCEKKARATFNELLDFGWLQRHGRSYIFINPLCPDYAQDKQTVEFE